jgi:shikimate kinase
VNNILLFGYKASGKTFFGRWLAQVLNRPFIDTDDVVERLYEEAFHDKKSCKEITIILGEEGFRSIERLAVASLIYVKDTVISLGGGTILSDKNRKNLEQLGLLVYLDADKEVIKTRLLNEDLPSFLDPSNPEESFEKHFLERKQIYESIPSFRLKMDGKTNPQILNELIQKIST